MSYLFRAWLWLWLTSALQAQQVVSAVGQNFTASTWGVDSLALPPDPNGAAGPQHFVEFINGRFAVFYKTNGAPVAGASVTDHVFWVNAGVSLPTGVALSDPRIVFDPLAQRWFAAAVDYNVSQTSNRFLLAISTSDDPAAGWKSVAFPTDPGQGQFADFPTLGVDAHAVYLAGDLFTGPTGVALGSNTLVSIPKSDLLGANPIADNRTWFGALSGASYGSIFQPVVSFEAAGGIAQVLAVGDLGHDFLPHSTLAGCSIQNAATSAATLSAPVTVVVPPYSVPINPPQPDGSSDLDDGDTRFSAMVRRVGGTLYAVHGVQVSGRAALRWYELNAADFSVQQSGTIADTNLDLFYPSIAANAFGTVVIGYNGCSSNSYVSCFAVVGGTAGGLTSFGLPVRLQAGQASYERLASGGVARWGDYSTTSPDPVDPNRFWTIQMFPAATNVWATQITEILTAVPVLTIAQAGTNLSLSWPGTAIAFDLEFATNLVAPSWTSVGQAPTAASPGMVSVQVPLPAGPQFFRLRQL